MSSLNSDEELKENKLPKSPSTPKILEVEEAEIGAAKVKIVASFVCATAGLILAIYVISTTTEPITPLRAFALAVALPYLFWATCLGLAIFWPNYKNMVENWGLFGLLYFPAYLGYAMFFGALGGGIYKMVRLRQILKRRQS